MVIYIPLHFFFIIQLVYYKKRVSQLKIFIDELFNKNQNSKKRTSFEEEKLSDDDDSGSISNISNYNENFRQNIYDTLKSVDVENKEFRTMKGKFF